MDPMPFRPLLRTQADVEAMWRRLMSPLGFSSHSLWMVVVEHDRPMPQVVEFSELPTAPREGDSESLARAIENLGATSQTSLAFLRTRPGSGRPDPDDLAWATTLYAAGHLADVPLRIIHLAHDHDVIPLPMDDLLAAPA